MSMKDFEKTLWRMQGNILVFFDTPKCQNTIYQWYYKMIIKTNTNIDWKLMLH